MQNKIGICSLCGGDVIGYSGIWMSVLPPPPGRCCNCGAIEETYADSCYKIIKMKMPDHNNYIRNITDNKTYPIKKLKSDNSAN